MHICREEDFTNGGGDHCFECNKKNVPLLHVGDYPDWERQWQRLCRECIEGALNLFESGTAASVQQR